MNRITQILNIKHPIVQAPMSWLTDAGLVASVAKAGGLGFLAPHAGQTTNPTSNADVLDRMRAEIRKVKALTDKPFGVPFMVSYDVSLIPLMVDLLIEEQVPVVLDNGWLDPDIYTKFKQAGIKIICRLPNPNLADALKAQELEADILVLTGFDEGGTLPMKETGSFTVLADFGTHRLSAQPADTVLEFSVKPDEIGNLTIQIAKGTQVLAGNVAFATTEGGQLNQNSPSIRLNAVCTQTGTVGNGYAVGQISTLATRPHPTVTVSAKNTTISQNGADVENDDSYRERIMLAFERFSNAGSKGAYAYFARSVSQEIIDVYVGNAIDRQGQPIGGTVAVHLLGKSMPISDNLIREVTKALNDEKVRPLCDTVTVNSARVVNFTLNAELTTFTGANVDEVLANAKSAFNTYKQEVESKLGQDVVPLNIAKTLQVAGVYDVKLISPTLTAIAPDTVAICNNINIRIVGQTDG